MAIDTQNKRRSTLARLPVPDAAITIADRPQVLWLYSGVIFGAIDRVDLTLIARSKTLILSARSKTLTLEAR